MCQVHGPTLPTYDPPTYTEESFNALCEMMHRKHGTPRWALVLEVGMDYARAQTPIPTWLR